MGSHYVGPEEAAEAYQLRLLAGVCEVPEHLVEGLVAYIIHGQPTGSFLEAVLSNDLMESFGRADEKSRAGMFGIAMFIYNHAPNGSYGNPAKVTAWLEKKAEERAARRA